MLVEDNGSGNFNNGLLSQRIISYIILKQTRSGNKAN
jgi:hypothetical protein